MKITQFKNMLALYGADIGRWDGADIDAVKALIRENAEARALYKEAEALDDALDLFDAGAADPALLDNIMARIGGEEARPEAVTVPEEVIAAATTEKGLPFINMRALPYWGGAIACALVVFVAVGLAGRGQNESHLDKGVTVAVAQNAAFGPAVTETKTATSDIDSFLAELGTLVEEDVAEQEIIGLLAMAQNSSQAVKNNGGAAPAAGEDIDAFLDRLFSGMEEEPAQEMDMWNLFLESEEL